MSLLSYYAVEDLREQTIIPYLRPVLHVEFIYLDSVVHALIDHGVTSGKKYKRAFVGDMLHFCRSAARWLLFSVEEEEEDEEEEEAGGFGCLIGACMKD